MLINKPIVKTFSLLFKEGQPEFITAKILSDYLYYISALNALLYQHSDDISIEDSANDVLQRISKYARETTSKEMYELELNELDLQVEGATKNSPFVIIFTGTVLLLAVAIIISGGKIDGKIVGVGEISVNLPPIADGLKKLKELFEGSK